MEAAQQQAQATETEPAEEEQAEQKRATRLCADCWNAKTFKDQNGRHMARCAQDLWVKPAFTIEELNNNRMRRWHADCPEYDDSE